MRFPCQLNADQEEISSQWGVAGLQPSNQSLGGNLFWPPHAVLTTKIGGLGNGVHRLLEQKAEFEAVNESLTGLRTLKSDLSCQDTEGDFFFFCLKKTGVWATREGEKVSKVRCSSKKEKKEAGPKS